ncbi:DMT family transporter [Psychrobacter sp. UBA3962]|uniref:DMT family transporter n=1 Tax=Psychrobacter sp. UBA3962 TaxID=1947352 RepID=UPI0025F9A2E4|nr:DMT family transporter [Psychrobacter sp. UBA3962]
MVKVKYTLGSAWMIVAAFLFALMNILVKNAAVQLDMNPYELAFWRSVLPALMIFCGTLIRGQTLKTPFFLGHMKRSVAGTTALLLAFYGLSQLPLATSVTLNYTSVVFIAILSIVWLKETPSLKTWTALLMGLAGICLMLKPAFESDRLIETLITLSGGIFTAFALLQVRALSFMGEPAWRIVFYFSAVAAAISAILATWAGWQSLTLESLPYMIGIGGTGLLAQLAMTHAYHVGQKFTVAALSYLTVVFAAIYGVVFAGETIGLIEVLGIVAVILAGVVSSLPEKKMD